MFCTETAAGEPAPKSLCEEEHILLCNVAREAIEYGLKTGRPPALETARFPAPLRELRSSFVTLHKYGELRGCMGNLSATRPLVNDVAQNAFNAAFRDPRFPPVQGRELADIELSISILSPAAPMHFTSEEDLLRQLRPGVDGLILQEGALCGTFLPSVWESLPERRDFLRHLKTKAGLPTNYWSPTVQVLCYTAEKVEEKKKG